MSLILAHDQVYWVQLYVMTSSLSLGIFLLVVMLLPHKIYRQYITKIVLINELHIEKPTSLKHR